MLQHLSIANVVLIDRCEIDLPPGLCVLTGETGAGKSILLDALGLALGARAESGLIRHGQQQATVSAQFDITANPAAKAMLEELGLEAEDTLILRRQQGADGRTRCFANDQPVSVAALRQLGGTLVEIHGQHDQRGLTDSATHLDALDAYGKLRPAREKTAQTYALWKSAAAALETCLAEMAAAKREEEYLRFIRTELSQLDPKPGEDEELARQRSDMMQSEKLAQTLNDVLQELGGDRPAENALRTAQRILSRSALGTGDRFAHIIESLERAATELEEATRAVEKIGENSRYDQATLERIEERLFAIKAAARKYNLPADELPVLLAQTTAKLAQIDTHSHREQALREEVTRTREAYRETAQALSAARRKQAATLEKKVMAELSPLKMGGTRFRVAIEELPETAWNARGMDAVRFEAATVAGADFASLIKIASGGELSRFMLALRVVLAGVKSTPTLIFDEIDTGTGGAVADAIGARLAALAGTNQVLVVTHLPQVAAKAGRHLLISREDRKTGTITTVTPLDGKARTEELARMLAGAKITHEARGAAQKLLEAAS